LQNIFFWFTPLGARNLYFLNWLNRITDLKNSSTFLVRLNKITHLKSALKGESKKFTLQEENLKRIFYMSRTKLAYFIGSKTYLPKNQYCLYIFLKDERIFCEKK
jgi:hypothetical protein